MAIAASAASPERGGRPESARRLDYIQYLQYLRIALVCLVVAHHAGQAYGPTGGAWPVREAGSIPILGPFFGVNAAFFMGLFFLISGYFVPGPLERHGTAAYVRGRLVRLGIPLLFMMVVVFFPSAWAGYQGPLGPVRFFVWNYFTNPNAAVGHMWFVEDLLLFTLAYVAWRAWRGKPPSRRQPAVPGHRALLLYAVALGLVTALVRVRYPVDRWVTWLVPSELAHLPQYVSLFVLGIVASRGAWFDRMPRRIGLVWLTVGFAASFAFLVAVAIRWPNPLIALGGWQLGTLTWSVWEAGICVGFCVGLVVVFREFIHRPSERIARFAENSYAVYVVHVPIVVALQGALLRGSLSLGANFLLVTAMGIVLSFGLAALLRTSATVRRVL